MRLEELELRELGLGDEAAFEAAVAEFAEVEPEWPFAFHYGESGSFEDYVERLRCWKRGERLIAGFVPNTFLVGVVAGRIVGRVSFRHELNEYLACRGGHVGYAVVPSHRRRGYAREMLRLTLPIAAGVGLKRVLLTCDADNVGSRRVIESNGGMFESETLLEESGERLRRYWITL